MCYVGGAKYYIDADSGQKRRLLVEVPFQRANLFSIQTTVNKQTAADRVTDESSYAEVKLHWNTFDFKRKMRVSKRAVGLFYLRAMLLYNMRSCLYPNATAQYFTCLLATPVE